MQRSCDSTCPPMRVGSRVCHCTTCHQTFGGVTGYDLHRQSGPVSGRRCAAVSDLIAAGLVLDETRIWRRATGFTEGVA